MAKLPECDRCRFYAYNPHLVCTIFPNGAADDHCPHFSPDSKIEPEELWGQGTKFIDDELVIERSFYDGVEITQPVQYLTPQEKLELIDTHPYFTGRCPQCEMPYSSDDTAPVVHWDCPHCGWIDDTI